VSIIIIRNGNASRVAASEFELESEMQKQLHANPGILPLHEIREGAELIAVVRELPVSAGYIDLLGFDAEGEVYVTMRTVDLRSTWSSSSSISQAM
jgi:RecB family endonuclease NucS